MALERLWFGMVTRNSKDSGSVSPVVLIVNQNGLDRLHHTFPDLRRRGGANLYELGSRPIDNLSNIDPRELDDSSVRVGIRGPNLWRPEHVVVWGIDANSQSVTAIGMGYELNTALSTDKDEGNISLPIRKMRTGGDDSPIRGLLMLMTTKNIKHAGTDSPIELQISVDNAIKVQFEIPDTPQKEQERGQANFYFVPVSNDFTRAELTDRAIRLSIKGADMWNPASFFLFGTDSRTTERPNELIPLVHQPDWTLGRLSTDSSEGESSVRLPIVDTPTSDPLVATDED